MRIAYVSTDRGVPVFGTKGGSIHVQEMIRAFLRLGHSVHLFASRLGGEAPPDLAAVGVTQVEGFDGKRPACLAAANEGAMASIGGTTWDLVYERYGLWGYAGMTVARRHGKPGILEVNAPLIDEAQRYRSDGLELEGALGVARQAFEAASTVVAVSEAVAGYVRRVAGPRTTVAVIPNGVDPRRFRAARRDRSDGQFVIGFVGTMKPWHGLDVLADAFVRLVPRIPNVRLLLVGDGPDRSRIGGLLAARGVADRVEWTGAVGPDQIPGLLARMDVAVAPYPNAEDCYFSPLKVFEYLAAGLPVVASRAGQVGTMLVPDRHAILVEPGDPDALVAGIERLVADPGLRHRIAGAGRILVESEYTWDRVASRVLASAGVARRPRSMSVAF